MSSQESGKLTERHQGGPDLTEALRQVLKTLDHPTILELGSRQVTPDNLLRVLGVPDGTYDYIGFDIYPGPNVDVVGDAHQLSRHIADESIDIVLTKSVFEHLAMPWKVVLEINQVLKAGGVLFTNTLFTFPLHELPWDFWRYTDQSWKVLLNEWTGFEILGTEMSVPCKITPETWHPGWNPEDWFGFVNSNVLARKTGPYNRERLRWDLTADDLLKSMYPPAPGAP